MNEGTVLVTVDGDVATVTLNRPEVHNAFDDALIARLTHELNDLAVDKDVRAVVLAARGKSFSAGADLNYMKRAAAFTAEENEADAMALGEMLLTLDKLPKPTLALIQGPAIGGGVGLACACDIAVASESAMFQFSEVTLGLIPAVISPFVINAIGESHARRYFLTAERISAAVALRIGLVHEVVPDEALVGRGESILKLLLRGGPAAHTAAKDLINADHAMPVDEALAAELAKRIASVRISPEGQEGIAAFLDKRKPAWRV